MDILGGGGGGVLLFSPMKWNNFYRTFLSYHKVHNKCNKKEIYIGRIEILLILGNSSYLIWKNCCSSLNGKHKQWTYNLFKAHWLTLSKLIHCRELTHQKDWLNKSSVFPLLLGMTMYFSSLWLSTLMVLLTNDTRSFYWKVCEEMFFCRFILFFSPRRLSYFVKFESLNFWKKLHYLFWCSNNLQSYKRQKIYYQLWSVSRSTH